MLGLRRLSLLLLLAGSPAMAEVQPLGELEIRGQIAEDEDVSAIEQLSVEGFVLGVDEGRSLQLIASCQSDFCRAGRRLPLIPGDGEEIDLEALAADERFLYAVGSHTCNRRRVRNNRSREDNRERMATVTCQESRDGLFRLPLDPQSGLPTGAVERQDLRRRLHHDPWLAPFARIPSKENGIDIEGLAVSDGRLYIGFRGPVLRGNWVPVMVTSFDRLDSHQLRWLRLGGRGIRSLLHVEGGFLVLAGAVGDADMSYQLYFWDGNDCLPDDGDSRCDLRLLGEVPAGDDTKPEGMTLLEDVGSVSSWEILVVYDSAEKGTPRRFRVTF